MTEDEARAHPFPHSREDAKSAQKIADTPQTRSPAYRLAFADMDFLLREEMRAIRLQLELLKPQMILDERGIESTVVDCTAEPPLVLRPGPISTAELSRVLAARIDADHHAPHVGPARSPGPPSIGAITFSSGPGCCCSSSPTPS